MENEEIKKEKIVFHWLTEQRTYVLKTESGKSYDEIVDEYIKKYYLDFPITNDDELKEMRNHRTKINGLKNDIEDARKQTTAVVINPLVNACKPLVEKLQNAYDQMTARMDEYKPKEPKPKTTTIITIAYPIGSEEIKKVKTYLNRAKITYKEEEK